MERDVILIFISFLLINAIKADFELLYQKIVNQLAENPSIIANLTNETKLKQYPDLKYEDYIHTYSEKVLIAGFRLEEHKVLTDDGYILTMWRIPGALGNYSQIRKKPVILQHGLLDDSYTFLALNIEKSLPLLLAREG